MQCAACGSTLSAPGAACTVCDPWATPVRTIAPPTALGLPQPTQLATPQPKQAAAPAQVPDNTATYLGSSLPRWYRVVIRRNPPVASADLEAAWRKTVISFAVNTAALVAFGAASAFAALDRTSSSYKTALVVFLGAVLLIVPVGLAYRRKTWLGRVVALLGTRPHIGYAALLRIPAMSRLNTLYIFGQNAGYAVCMLFLLAHRDGWVMTCSALAAVLVVHLVQFALLSAAREPVARLLAS